MIEVHFMYVCIMYVNEIYQRKSVTVFVNHTYNDNAIVQLVQYQFVAIICNYISVATRKMRKLLLTDNTN